MRKRMKKKKMMNKYSLMLFFLVLSLVMSAQTNLYRINGTVSPQHDGDLVTLFTFTGDYIRSVDSAYVANGHFSFTGSEYLYERSLISMGNYPDTVLVAELLLERGPIEVKMNVQSEVYSPIQKEYQQYLDSCAILYEPIATADGQEGQEEVLNAAWQRFYAYKFQFKKKHIHDGIGRALFLDESGHFDDPYFYELYELLTDKDKQRCDVRSDYERRRRHDEQRQLVNKPYLNFKLINSVGEDRQISDYVGKSKLLFLDFWASWCGPCIAQKPQIRELYDKYKEDGFEILGISLDENREHWLTALKKTENAWPELGVESREQVEELRKLYSITGIPAGVLIDQSGTIIHTQCGRWQMLKLILEAYYKK